MSAISGGSKKLRRRLCFTTLCGLLILAVNAIPADAQLSASISGRVEDASGAGVSGATVTVKSVETGAARVVTTGDSGSFTILALPLGPQEVKAEKTGFQPAVRTGISLSVGQEVKVNLRLKVGEFVQQVTVSEEAPVVNTATAPVSGMVGQRQLKDLPLNGRSFDNLLTLNPGAVNYSAMKSAGTSTSNGNTFAVAGRRTYENLFLLNGIEDTGSSQLAVTPGGVSGQLLGIEAVREFNVLTSAYSAEYGKRPGAQVSVVTQSGTNALHGSLFEFLRNSALDARNFFDQASAPPFRRNQFGAAAGGPLKKDRLFVFGNYEGFRQALSLSSVSVVPDQPARQGILPNASGILTPVAFNPAMLKYMSFWPQPNGAELLVNGLPSGTALSYNNPKQAVREDFGTLRTDYSPRDRDTLSGAYTIDDGNNLTPLADPLFGSYSTLRSQVASVQETHIVSAHALNTARLGFSRAAFDYQSFALADFPASDSFVSGGGPGGIVIGGGVTTTGVAAITAAGPNNAANVWNRRSLFTYTDTFQFSKGIHQISAGVWFQRLRDNENTASRRLGQASFASLQTFLQGTLTTFQVVPTPNELGWRSLLGAWYVEDAIRIRPNLTFEVGLRHEFTTGWNEASGRAANYLINQQGVLVTDPQVSGSVFTDNNARRLLGPRVSLAWDPFRNGKTAVRAGFGTYFSLIDDLAFLLNSIPPYNGSVSFQAVSLPSILPILPGVAPPPSCGPNVPQPCTTYAPQGIQPNAKTPTVEEWNLTVEQELSRNTVLRVAYVGSFGYHGLLSVDPNSIPVQICSNPAGCVSGGSGAARGSVGQGAQYIPVGARPNPYLSGGFFWYTEGNSSYNALQVDATRRLSHGLQFRANYTWAKNLDINSGLTGAQANNQAQMVLNRNNPRQDWGPSALNITHQASISTTYELPGGKGGPAGLGRLTSGWQLNAIVTVLGGFPFTPQIGSNRSGDGDTRNPDRPSVNPTFTGPVLLRKPTQWLNPNAFILPAVGTYGNLGRGTLTGPGLGDVDLSLFKNTAVSERANVQFRAEFFNLFNRANFGTPNAILFSNGAISSTAGLITATATTSRQIQFGLKLIF
ncbi:MAG TPA: carboxypeptidase-like regulatory domain-containing protein [Bryobacteraceae bacterium]|nr:carboxypeptidase-like regulatory domain-containing protein [Bryobacteraceae bacterium]